MNLPSSARKQSRIEFTSAEQAFFDTKVPILDPDSKHAISMRQARSLLSRSGLPPEKQNAIFNNLELTTKRQLSYTEMKMVLRGVALAQERIQPTRLSINANIWNNLPVFFEEEDEGSQSDEKQTGNSPQTTNFMLSSGANQQTTNQMKRFESLWVTLQTEGDKKISGTQVKKLFGNQAHHKELSKIWKLCNHTYNGYLTKGQFSIFVILINSDPQHLPQVLTPQLREIIRKVDSKRLKSAERRSLSPLHSNDFLSPSEKLCSSTESYTKGASNQNNYNFPQFNKITESPLTSSQKSIQNTPDKQKLPSRPPLLRQSTSEPKIARYREAHGLSSSAVAAKQPSGEECINISQQVFPQLNALLQENKQYNLIIQETHSFLSSIKQSHQMVMEKIADLKAKQLNVTCKRMKDIIVKQAEQIEELTNSYNNRVQIDKEKMEVLTGYLYDITQQVNQKIRDYHDYRSTIQNKALKQTEKRVQNYPSQCGSEINMTTETPQFDTGHGYLHPPSLCQQSIDENLGSLHSWFSQNGEDTKYQQPIDQKDHQLQQSMFRQIFDTDSSQQTIKQAASINEPAQPKAQDQQDASMHRKVVLTLHLMDMISPIKSQQYQSFRQRIASMPQKQLNSLYDQIYNKYQRKNDAESIIFQEAKQGLQIGGNNALRDETDAKIEQSNQSIE